MKTKILTILKESGGYVSGQDLCSRLGVSRTAVWKAIKQLEEEGCRIEAVRNKGYRLTAVEDGITQAQIGSLLKTKYMGRNLVYFAETDSTNIQIKRLAEAGSPEGTLVVAESQTAGKGRRGRSWFSPPGSSIFMSYLLRPNILPYHASMLTLLAGMACARAVREETGLKAEIKWPNDLVLSGKKICGILTEMSTELEEIHYIFTGIGINVNQTEFPEEIRNTATSLKLEREKQQEKEGCREFSRSVLIASCMKWFEDYYERFLFSGDFSQLKEEYESMLVNLNREVLVLDPAGEYSGVCRGIDAMGRLLVELPHKEVKAVLSGEVSVRGIYGYV